MRLEIFLPFFGEQRMGEAYNNDKEIEYHGKIEELEVKLNEKSKDYYISFRVKNASETYEVGIQLFSDLSSQVMVQSSHRSFIKYDGYAKAIEIQRKE